MTHQRLHATPASRFWRRSWHVAAPALVILTFILAPGSACTAAGAFETHPGHRQVEDTRAPLAPGIYAISTNVDDYPGQAVPRYEKFEITFQLTTVAQNLQLPYDAAPPPGVTPGIGISVNAQFSADGWQTVYTQPAFLYQEFENDVRQGQEWFYPTDHFRWKVRFAPPSSGQWQFRLTAEDAGGATTTAAQSFAVTSSQNPGFVRVSQRNPRTFERENGEHFPALGYNMNFDHVSWANPVLDNEADFQVMSDNGIQLVRIWLSQWGIYGPSWNPWNSADSAQHGAYVPYSGLTFGEAYGDSEISMRVGAIGNPCMFIGLWKAPPAVKRNADYRVRIRVKTTNVSGPRLAGAPYGFVAKTGPWLSGDACDEPGTGATVTPHLAQTGEEWQILEGSLNSGANDFLPYFYLVMDNASGGAAFVDRVWIEEDRGDGTYGPNIVSKPWMAHHLYMEQRNSYAFDRLLELADQVDVNFKVVIGEKLDWIFNRIDFEGQPIPFDERCHDNDPQNDPEKCPGNEWYYGDFRQVTKVRWLQQAWWRYVQARWGYSTQIHSWELLNEGDPASTRHFALADELGAFMRQFAPNHHLVTTSFWHSFPRDAFWTNPDYARVDYADVHRYITQSEPASDDAALATYEASMAYGLPGTGTPIMRGETGFVTEGSGPPLDILQEDLDGVWLHNYLWGSLNAGGLIESYWYEQFHIIRRRPNGTILFDHRHHFRPYRNFLQHLDLNRGLYTALQVQTDIALLRAWGRRDAVADRAHLWIQNREHRWRNVVEGQPMPAVSGIVSLGGLRPSTGYTVRWWDTWQPDPAMQLLRSEILHSDASGLLALAVDGLDTDVAVTISGDGAQGSQFRPLMQRILSPALTFNGVQHH